MDEEKDRYENSGSFFGRTEYARGEDMDDRFPREASFYERSDKLHLSLHLNVGSGDSSTIISMMKHQPLVNERQHTQDITMYLDQKQVRELIKMLVKAL